MKSNTKKLNLVFAGTPEFAAAHLYALIETIKTEPAFTLSAVYTQPDRPSGRGKKLTASPVKEMALNAQLPVYQPLSLREASAQDQLRQLKPDLLIVVAYGLILPQAILDIPTYGCINVHGSLLPKWRGAAPIQRACWAGDQETGITIMQMDAGLDSGAMLLKKKCAILPTDTSATLYDKLAHIAPPALIEVLNQLLKGKLNPEQQDESQVTYAKKLTKEEARLDWHLPASQLERNVRAFNPWPICHLSHKGQTFKIWQAQVRHENSAQPLGTITQVDKLGLAIQCAEGQFVITELQPEGKKRMPFHDYLNAKPDFFVVNTAIDDLAHCQQKETK